MLRDVRMLRPRDILRFGNVALASLSNRKETKHILFVVATARRW
jgi:hypothetical protein